MTLQKFLKLLSLVSTLMMLSLSIQAQEAPNATVVDMAATLNLRESASLRSPIIVELAGGTALVVFERSADDWFHARTTEGQSGWLSARFVQLNADINSIPDVTSDSSPAEVEASVQAPQTVTGGARVSRDVIGLNMRNSPSLSGAIVGQLSGGTSLNILGQNEAGTWLQVQIANGSTGWVFAQYIDNNVSNTSIVSDDAPSDSIEQAQPSLPDIVAGDLSSIYQRGLVLGNFRNNFSKVGDSITTSELFLFPIGYGQYDLGGFGYLQSVIDYFSVGNNSFLHNSLAAGSGWTTDAVLNPSFADPGICAAGEIPLECEYRLNKPAVALIMLGTNDVLSVSSEDFAGRMQRIVQITLDHGTIPVISTLPNRPGFEAQISKYNEVIRAIATQNSIPLWDFSGAIWNLYNFGVSGDNIHPTRPSGGFADAVKFTGENLTSGYVIRNLTALQMLHTVWQAVLA